MFRAYCNNEGCGTEIINVEPWLLAAIPDKWQCRPCFYNKKEPTGQCISAEFADTTVSNFEEAVEEIE